VLQELNKQHMPEISDAMARANEMRARRMKLLSLTSESPDRSPLDDFDRAYARPRMWDQYGDKHRGVCLVFDRAALDAAITASLSPLGLLWSGEVTYDNAALASAVVTANELRLPPGRDVTEEELTMLIVEHLAEHQKVLLFTKMADYKDERELRYVVHDNTEEPYVWADFADALHAVVLGEAFPDDKVQRASDAAIAAGIAIRRMRWGPYGPRVVPIE